MNIAITFVVIIVIISLLGTLVAAGKIEHDYTKSTKRNVTNLTAIYVVLFIGMFAGVAWYLVNVL